MHVIGKWLNARGEFIIIDNDRFIGPLSSDLPAIIQVDVNVPFFVQSKFNDFIGDLFYNCFIDITFKQVPAIPSHGRCFPDSIVDSLN